MRRTIFGLNFPLSIIYCKKTNLNLAEKVPWRNVQCTVHTCNASIHFSNNNFFLGKKVEKLVARRSRHVCSGVAQIKKRN